jgi:hypothetical protein
VLEEGSVIGRVIYLFGVKKDLVELPKLGERGYNLVGDVCAEVNREGELSIGDSNEISKFLTTFELPLATLLYNIRTNIPCSP